MQTTITKSRQEYEETIMEIAHRLPLDRLLKVIELVRSLQTETDVGLEEKETTEKITTSEGQ